MKKKKTIKKQRKQKVAQVEGVYQQAIRLAADFFREGHSESKIAELVHLSFSVLTEANIQLVIHKGSQLIADEFARDRNSVVALHVKRYNNELRQLLQKKAVDPNEDLSEARKARINELLYALEVLRAKEKVLQLHNKDTQIKIFNKLNAKIKEKQILYDLSGLTLEEKIEFLTLIRKAKRTQNELYSIKMMNRAQEVTEDVEHQIVDGVNVDKIKTVNEDKPKQLPAPRKNADDITKKIQEALLKKATKKFKEHGASEDKGPEVIDYRDLNKKE